MSRIFIFHILFLIISALPCLVNSAVSINETPNAPVMPLPSEQKTSHFPLTDEERRFIAQNPSVTIGMLPDFKPFSFNDGGQEKGVVYDILALISQKTGLTFDYKMDYWPNIFPQFREGQLDAIANISYKEERVPFTLYTTPYYEIPTAIFIRNNFGEYEGLQSLRGKRVAMTPDIFYAKELKAYGGLNLVGFHTYDEMIKALAYGKVDAVIQSLVIIDQIIQKNAYTNIVMAEEFLLPTVGREDLRFGINPEKPTLQHIIQKGLDGISDLELTAIVNKWLGAKYVKLMETHQKTPLYSQDEISFLKKSGPIKICVDADWPPFQSIDAQGNAMGIVPDLLHLIEERSPIVVAVVKTENRTQSMTFIQDGTCDLCALAHSVSEGNPFLDFIPADLASPLVIVTRTEELFVENLETVLDKPLVMTKRFGLHEMFKVRHPDMDLIEADTVSEGLELVRRKKAYGLIDSLVRMAYTLQTEGIVDLKIAGKLDDTLDIGIAIKKGDVKLHTIMSKALDTVNQMEKQKIYNKWFAVKYEQGVDYALIWKISAGASFLIIVMLYWNRKLFKAREQTQAALKELKEAQERLEHLAITDRLTGLYNRFKLDEASQDELNKSDRLGHPLAVILLDIDHFKEVNDTHGHQVGDQVLIALANLLQSHVRKTDTLGRWGGEEFLILCPGTDSKGLKKFSNNLRKSIESYDFPVVSRKTASFGGTVYQNGESIEQMISRADEALYQAKKRGRNRVVIH